MAAERDEAGSQGPGLSGTGRDHSGIEAGTTRSMPMGDAPGSADVHAGIAFNTNAETDEGVRERTVNRVKDVAGDVAEAASGLGERARTVASDVADRAGDLASRAKDRVGDLAGRAQGMLEERGWLDRMKENPLPALGVAFAAGFLLAGGGSGTGGEVGGGGTGGARSLRGSATRVRGELRGALAAGLSAGLAQGARAFLRNVGAEDGVINSVIQNLPGLGGDEYAGGQPSRGAPAAGRGSRGGRGSVTRRRGSYPRGGTLRRDARRRGAGRDAGRSAQRHREPSHRESFSSLRWPRPASGLRAGCRASGSAGGPAPRPSGSGWTERCGTRTTARWWWKRADPESALAELERLLTRGRPTPASARWSGSPPRSRPGRPYF